MEYNASMIRVKNIPKLEQLSNKQRRRTYSYFFSRKLPEQKKLDIISKSLEPKFKLLKELYFLPKDVEICASTIIERVQDYEAKVSILTTEPEEDCIYLFGIYTLPRKLKEIFGTIQSI